MLANDTTSTSQTIKQGVPQGSILGPLLYIIYANDIKDTLTNSKVAFYADDTVLYSSNKDLTKAMANIQKDLDSISEWYKLNGIYINPTKTKYMIFSNKTPKLNRLPEPTINGKTVERVSQYKYLGVTLDEHLTFGAHITGIIHKVTCKVQQLRRIRRHVTTKAALLIYKNMILPLVEQGDIYLNSATKENRKKLQILQNKALKCALAKEGRFNTKELHSEAKLGTLKTRRKKHLLLHMYQISNLNGFKGWKTRSNIRTRSSLKKLMKVKKPNLVKFQRSIAYLGPKLWNGLPKNLQTATSYGEFKTLLNAPD